MVNYRIWTSKGPAGAISTPGLFSSLEGTSEIYREKKSSFVEPKMGFCVPQTYSIEESTIS